MHHMFRGTIVATKKKELNMVKLSRLQTHQLLWTKRKPAGAKSKYIFFFLLCLFVFSKGLKLFRETRFSFGQIIGNVMRRERSMVLSKTSSNMINQNRGNALSSRVHRSVKLQNVLSSRKRYRILKAEMSL